MLSIINKETMTHKEIANLVQSRDDSVKRTIERLSERGVISFTPMVETQQSGAVKRSVTSYHVNERDSYIVVAQLSPEFTAFLVDEWQKRKSQSPKLPDFTNPAIAARAWADEVEARQAAMIERDHAIATKAQINDKRTATLMNKASQDAKRIKKLESKLQDAGTHLSLIAARLPERIDTEFKSNVQTWRVLKQISLDMNCDIVKVDDQRYGQANTYHIDVIEKFKELYL